MSSIESLTELLGWCSVINIGLLVLAALAMVFMREPLMAFHSRLLGLTNDDLSRAYFQYLAQYKLAIIVFNLVPYVALKIIA